MSEDREGTPRFAVVESDRFEADRDRAILFVGRPLSSLPAFPLSLPPARDEEARACHFSYQPR